MHEKGLEDGKVRKSSVEEVDAEEKNESDGGRVRKS